MHKGNNTGGFSVSAARLSVRSDDEGPRVGGKGTHSVTGQRRLRVSRGIPLSNSDTAVAAEDEFDTAIFQSLLKVTQGSRLWDTLAAFEILNCSARHFRLLGEVILRKI